MVNIIKVEKNTQQFKIISSRGDDGANVVALINIANSKCNERCCVISLLYMLTLADCWYIHDITSSSRTISDERFFTSLLAVHQSSAIINSVQSYFISEIFLTLMLILRECKIAHVLCNPIILAA